MRARRAALDRSLGRPRRGQGGERRSLIGGAMLTGCSRWGPRLSMRIQERRPQQSTKQTANQTVGGVWYFPWPTKR